MDDRSIQPDGLYSSDEAAHLLGFRSANQKANRNRLYEISYEELARVPVGAKGGRIMFLGRDILAYIEARRTTRKSA